jgi:tetratricopeptide (TPR) repeat protein
MGYFDIWNNKKKFCVFGVLFLLPILAYSNTLESSWHLDDYDTIVANPRLHFSDLSIESVYNSFFSRSENLFRPVACLTFGLNWYFGNGQVAGFHMVNLGIHILTAFFLFFAILNLYRSPRLIGDSENRIFFIALLTAAFWALNPVQTQGVTYIVQRMASLATMFYMMAIYCYLKGRISTVKSRQKIYFGLCVIGFFLALGSKENSITLPLSLFLLEIIFFQNMGNPITRKKIIISVAIISSLLILLALIYFTLGNGFRLLNDGHSIRSFTLLQRLMTESRIVILYISQLLYPNPLRLSIEHDILISTSLFHPWTTLPAIGLLTGLIALALAGIRKWPVFGFAVLFFFLNHAIESSFLPLELIFEHRNYLPSLFFFWPIAVGLIKLIEYYQTKQPSTARVVGGGIVVLVMLLAASTYIRNMAWATEKTLWEDAMHKAPGRARPAFNLAKHYHLREGRLDAALQLYSRALNLDAATPAYSKAMALNGMASIYYSRQDFAKALQLCQKALAIYPAFESGAYNSVLALMKMEQWQEASRAVDLLLTGKQTRPAYLLLKGAILNRLNRGEMALGYLRQALKTAPNNRNVLMNIGIALGLSQHYRQAQWFFSRAIHASHRDIRPYFYLIEASVKSGSAAEIEQHLAKLFATFSVNAIMTGCDGNFNDLYLMPPSVELLAPVIYRHFIKTAEGITGPRRHEPS